ncbi:MAG: hypothetical protein IT203_11160 [Fimbriimonadaceae bacterium]|nr:hypothetical protein [Fimbriimonadaceae bacterium]
MRRAVIDVGSNSVLLVVAEQSSQGWNSIFEEIDVTALGEGTKSTKRLGEAGMAATLVALRRFYEKARELGAESVKAGVTMAARIAENTPDFLERARAQGTPIFVVSGEDEAELGFRAVADDPSFAAQKRISIIDPGGHSTELVTAERCRNGWKTLFQRSFPVGTLGLKSTHFPHERLNPVEILSASAAIDDLIGMNYLPGACGTAFVLGATGTNLVTIRERIVEWDPVAVHGAWLDYEEISKAFGAMAELDDRGRAAIVGLEPGREKTIHIGALILERFLFALRSSGCFVSVRGWRHALIEHGLPSERDKEILI